MPSKSDLESLMSRAVENDNILRISYKGNPEIETDNGLEAYTLEVRHKTDFQEHNVSDLITSYGFQLISTDQRDEEDKTLYNISIEEE